MTDRAADTHNQILWDPLAQVYRLYTRTDFGDDDVNEWRGNRCMINPDVKANPAGWKTLKSWKFDQEGSYERWRRQIYGLTDWIYEGFHVAASCAFLTPVGHKNNIIVMGPGGYRFGDYWRMGLPLEILVVLVGLPMILIVWPL